MSNPMMKTLRHVAAVSLAGGLLAIGSPVLAPAIGAQPSAAKFPATAPAVPAVVAAAVDLPRTEIDLVRSAAAARPRLAPVRFLVVAANESILSASTAGRFAKIAVQLGDSVRAGQVVASYDCAEIAARREAGVAEAESARVQYEAKMTLQGLQSAAAVEVELAAANLNKARSQIKIVDAQLAQCSFVAPFSGKVARVHVKVGQGINPGAPVVELVGNGSPKARMNVPSHWLAWMKVGDELDGTIDETGSASALKVSRISGRVDAVSQTVEIEADFVKSAGLVLPGMSGQLKAQIQP